MIPSAFQATRLMFKDKIILALSMVPVAIGVGLYIGMGSWFYSSILGWGDTWIKGHVSESWGVVVYYLLFSILTVLLFFIVNWTFVLIVSILASPFNDAISHRVEKILGGETPESLGGTFKRILANAIFSFINQIKKVAFIVVLASLGLLLSLFPVLAPISMIITAVLLSIEFMDYSWSRHDIPFSACKTDVKNHLIEYILTGGGFATLIAIPVVNLFVLPYGVIYYTTLWTNNKKDLIGYSK